MECSWEPKAGGASGIVPEMMKAACCEEEFMSQLMKLVHDVWKVHSVPSNWCDAILVPTLKKGDLRSCDNWRGISLLNVAEKVVARVLQERLQTFRHWPMKNFQNDSVGSEKAGVMWT